MLLGNVLQAILGGMTREDEPTKKTTVIITLGDRHPTGKSPLIDAIREKLHKEKDHDDTHEHDDRHEHDDSEEKNGRE